MGDGQIINKLTENLVVQKTRVEQIHLVKNLNLWGNDLQDVSLLREMSNVEVLSLSINKIESLQDFQYCNKLQELYLRKNLIADLAEVQYLKNLPQLKILWLCDNPCADSPLYRPFIIRTLTHLEKLDNIDITPEERSRVSQLNEREFANVILQQKPKRAEQQQPPPPQQRPERHEHKEPPRAAAEARVRKEDVIEGARSKWQKPQEHPLDHDIPANPAHRAAAQGDRRSVERDYVRAPNVGQPQQPPHGSAAPKPKRTPGRSASSTQKHLLSAVLSILNELNAESLETVLQDVQEKLRDAQ